jgi:hypothetical protein
LQRLLNVIDDGVRDKTVELIAIAADERSVDVRLIDPRRHDFSGRLGLAPGDMVYRPAVSMHALRVEQDLWHPHWGVSTSTLTAHCSRM